MPARLHGETLRNAEADAGDPVTRVTLLASLLVIVSSHRVRPHQQRHPTLQSRVTYELERGGTFAKRSPSPSAIVGCARIASRSHGYGRSASIAVCTTAMTSPASAPIIVKPRMRSSLAPTRTFMKPCVS